MWSKSPSGCCNSPRGWGDSRERLPQEPPSTTGLGGSRERLPREPPTPGLELSPLGRGVTTWSHALSGQGDSASSPIQSAHTVARGAGEVATGLKPPQFNLPESYLTPGGGLNPAGATGRMRVCNPPLTTEQSGGRGREKDGGSLFGSGGSSEASGTAIPVAALFTQAAEATTNHENDNEPRRTASNMKPTRESDGAPTPRKELNASSRSAIYANRSSKPVSYTHTDQELQANQRQAAPSTERRSRTHEARVRR